MGLYYRITDRGAGTRSAVDRRDVLVARNTTRRSCLVLIRSTGTRSTKPGRYQYKFGWLAVATEDLSIWEKYPNAVFTLVSVQAEEDSPAEEYRLGTFELR